MGFLNNLPFLKAFIPGRVEYIATLKTAIVEEVVIVKKGGKQRRTKTGFGAVRPEKHRVAVSIKRKLEPRTPYWDGRAETCPANNE